jgi:hypothetical protein
MAAAVVLTACGSVNRKVMDRRHKLDPVLISGERDSSLNPQETSQSAVLVEQGAKDPLKDQSLPEDARRDRIPDPGASDPESDLSGKGNGLPYPVERGPREGPGQNASDNPSQTPADSILPSLKLVRLNTSGPGCAPGTVAQQISADSKAFTLLFSAFQLTYAPSEDLFATSTSCLVELEVTSSPGWQWSILTLDYRGFADLPSGVTAEIATGFRLESQSAPVYTHASLVGPMADNYSTRSTFFLTRWSRCGATTSQLVVETSLRLKPEPTLPALVSVDSTDGVFRHQVGLSWRKCVH